MIARQLSSPASCSTYILSLYFLKKAAWSTQACRAGHKHKHKHTKHATPDPGDPGGSSTPSSSIGSRGYISNSIRATYLRPNRLESPGIRNTHGAWTMDRHSWLFRGFSVLRQGITITTIIQIRLLTPASSRKYERYCSM